MRTKLMLTAAAGLLAAGLVFPAIAANVMRGRDLLTAEEWQAHRSEMQQAQTLAERLALRDAMMQTLQTRAEEQGVTLLHGIRGTGPGAGNGPGQGWGHRKTASHSMPVPRS